MPLRKWITERFAPRPLGEAGEQAAVGFLRRLGYKIIATRHRMRYGEVDIIAVDDSTVVFVEVKTRRDTSRGRPADAVDARRQSRLTNAALAFLKSHDLLEYASRFDVVEVAWPTNQKRPTIHHIQDAFPAVGRGQMYK
ncbi:MAG: YraN family protein [Pirellulales bacterium]|nr:YraN family protein [Pirellulales bacterium]